MTIKFVKDSSQHTSPDMFKFKPRSTSSTKIGVIASTTCYANEEEMHEDLTQPGNCFASIYSEESDTVTSVFRNGDGGWTELDLSGPLDVDEYNRLIDEDRDPIDDYIENFMKKAEKLIKRLNSGKSSINEIILSVM